MTINLLKEIKRLSKKSYKDIIDNYESKLSNIELLGIELDSLESEILNIRHDLDLATEKIFQLKRKIKNNFIK